MKHLTTLLLFLSCFNLSAIDLNFTFTNFINGTDWNGGELHVYVDFDLVQIYDGTNNEILQVDLLDEITVQYISTGNTSGFNNFNISGGNIMFDYNRNAGTPLLTGVYSMAAMLDIGIVMEFLPVNLLLAEVTQKDDHNLINWETETETDNLFFELEHSIDGLNFRRLEIINGAGTSLEKKEYQYKHYTILENSIYRLSQTDFDGTKQYLKTMSVRSDHNYYELFDFLGRTIIVKNFNEIPSNSFFRKNGKTFFKVR